METPFWLQVGLLLLLHRLGIPAGGRCLTIPHGARTICTPNPYFEDFVIQHPPSNSLVPSVLFLRMTGRAFDIPKVQQMNNEFSMCLHLDGSPLVCNLDIFDEIEVHFALPGQQLLTVELHLDGVGVICKASVEVECCSEGDDYSIRQAVERLEQQVDGMLAFTQRAVSFDRISAQTSSVESAGRQCPWCCPAAGVRTVIGIKSAATHTAQREAIRSTWLQRLPSRSCAYFIIGNIGGAPSDDDGYEADPNCDVSGSYGIARCAPRLISLMRATLDAETALYGDILEAPQVNAQVSHVVCLCMRIACCLLS